VLLGGTSNGVGFEWDNSTGTTIIGSAVLQLDNPVVQVAQSYWVGGLEAAGASGCSWSGTSTTFTNFSANTDCNVFTAKGSIKAPSTRYQLL
jgi:hypothetical protein